MGRGWVHSWAGELEENRSITKAPRLDSEIEPLCGIAWNRARVSRRLWLSYTETGQRHCRATTFQEKKMPREDCRKRRSWRDQDTSFSKIREPLRSTMTVCSADHQPRRPHHPTVVDTGRDWFNLLHPHLAENFVCRIRTSSDPRKYQFSCAQPLCSTLVADSKYISIDHHAATENPVITPPPPKPNPSLRLPANHHLRRMSVSARVPQKRGRPFQTEAAKLYRIVQRAISSPLRPLQA